MEPRPANPQQWILSGLIWPLYADTPRPGTAISRQSRQTPRSNATYPQHTSPNGIQRQLSGQHIAISPTSRLALLGQLVDPIHQHPPAHNPQMVPQHHLHPTSIATANTNRPHQPTPPPQYLAACIEPVRSRRVPPVRIRLQA